MPPSTHESSPTPKKSNWAIIAGLWPYLAEYRGRVFFAMAMLILAKVATVSTPSL
nr:hypothetical protein [Paenalcaligenes hominis]